MEGLFSERNPTNTNHWSLIKSSLEDSSIRTVKDLENIISIWSPMVNLSSLYKYENSHNRHWEIFVDNGFQRVRDLVLNADIILKDFSPRLLRHDSYDRCDEDMFLIQVIEIDRDIVACLLANMFMCTFVQGELEWEFQECNMGKMFYMNASSDRLLNVLQYFNAGDSVYDESQLKISRCMLNGQISELISRSEDASLIPIEFVEDEDRIDVGKVIFSDMYIGGGVLDQGRGQEEFILGEHTEALVSLVFCSKMEFNESIVITGARKVTMTPSASIVPSFDMIYIDAFPFYVYHCDEWSEEMIYREISKSYAGFINSSATDIATAAWGCGTFGGDIQLKLMIQWISATMADKQLFRWEYHWCRHILQYKEYITYIQNAKPNYKQILSILLTFSGNKTNLLKEISDNVRS